MPAVIPYVKLFFGWLAEEGFAQMVVKTILVNIALSSHEFFDENGEPYIAVDD